MGFRYPTRSGLARLAVAAVIKGLLAPSRPANHSSFSASRLFSTSTWKVRTIARGYAGARRRARWIDLGRSADLSSGADRFPVRQCGVHRRWVACSEQTFTKWLVRQHLGQL